MSSLKIGDVVVVTSQEGPLMTVEGISNTHIACVWFDTRDQLHRAQFLAELVEKVDVMAIQKVN